MLIEGRTDESPVVVLDVPPDFHQVPLDEGTEERTASQLQILRDLGLTDREQREALSLFLEGLAIRLSRGSVLSAAFCAVEIAGHPSTATLTVALHPTGTADGGLVVLGAAEAMRREGRYSSVDIRQVGPYPGVTAVVDRAATPTGAVAADEGATLREMTVLVPLPGHEQVTIMTLSTPCLEDWQLYETVLLDIARSIRVEAPSVSGSTTLSQG